MKLGLLFAGMMVALLAISSPIQAQTGAGAGAAAAPGTASEQVAAILARFPNGGAEMRAAIAQAVALNPAIAQTVGVASRGANVAQQDAIGAGMADAAVLLSNSPTTTGRAAARQVLQAMLDTGVGTIQVRAQQTEAVVDQNIAQNGGTGDNANGAQQNQPAPPVTCASPSGDGQTCLDGAGGGAGGAGNNNG